MIDAIRNSRASDYQRHGENEGAARTERRGHDATGSIGGMGSGSATTHQTLVARAPYESFDFGVTFSPPAPATLSRFIENHKVATHHPITIEGTAEDKARGDSIRSHLREYTVRADNGVEFTVPFRMAQSPAEVDDANQKLVKALGGDGAPGTRHAPMAVLGRATPAQLREVCQALARRYPEKFANASGAQDYLRELRVGIDCAGFVQNALTSLTGKTPPLGLREKGMENLSQLASNPDFRARSSPTEARPGDVITLKPTARDGVGHTLIVTERGTARGEALCGVGFDLRPDDQVTVLSVAASWGSGQPEEQRWAYNPRTGQWGSLRADGKTVAYSGHPRGPYLHELENIWAPRF